MSGSEERRLSTVSGASTTDLDYRAGVEQSGTGSRAGALGTPLSEVIDLGSDPEEVEEESAGGRKGDSDLNVNQSNLQSNGSSSSTGGRDAVKDVAILLKTMEFASRKHEHQRRKNTDSTPYINHPLGVAHILSSYGVTHLPTLQAAILHDTVEDTDTSLEEISEEFGEEVARIVKECTDPAYTSSKDRKALQVKTASGKSKEARQVKLGDKLHNLRSIREDPPVGWTPKRCQEYFSESTYILGS